MNKGEISLFKVEFASEEDNLYLVDKHSRQVLNEEARQKIHDKTCIFLKFTVKDIMRDCKDITQSELKKVKEDKLAFIKNRVEFASICKAHANLALKEKCMNEALKLYRKGTGAMKMISNSIVKEIRAELENNYGEDMIDEDLETQLTEINTLRAQLMLNQGFCYWKEEDFEKMAKINQEILTVYDPDNAKALYRYALACQQLERYDEGLESVKTLLKQPKENKNKDAIKLYKQLKELSGAKKKKWAKKMDGFLVSEAHSFQKITGDEEKQNLLKKKIEVEMEHDPQIAN